jgi:nitroimidazol reductase NimA-like FMN-containing flavoprotein (pyridoxamine 5'-phosphate oxidase superfamily)
MAEMTREEVHAWLDKGPRWARLATIGRDGYPHVVPLGYFRLDDDVYVSMRGQRLVNVKRNPKVCLLVDEGEGMRELKGAVIEGDATLVEDPSAIVEVLRESARRRGTPEDQLPTEAPRGRSYIKITPRKIASWDNSKQ